MANAVAERPAHQPVLIGETRGDLLPNLMKAAARADLPDSLSPDRLAKCAALLLQKNHALLQTTQESFFLALIEAGQAGLEPDGKYATIVPYGKVAQFQTMVWGEVELARRSGHVHGIPSKTVHEGDQFTYEEGLTPKLVHVPNLDVERMSETLTHVYAIARMVSGPDDFEVMTKAQVEDIRKRSKAKSGPWYTDYLEMAKKTVIRRLKKRLPSSYEDRRLIEKEEKAEYEGVFEDITLPPLEPPKTKTERLTERLTAGDPGEIEHDKLDEAAGASPLELEPEEAGDGAEAVPGTADAPEPAPGFDSNRGRKVLDTRYRALVKKLHPELLVDEDKIVAFQEDLSGGVGNTDNWTEANYRSAIEQLQKEEEGRK